MNVMTPYHSELQVSRDGFAQLLRAEWTKFRTVRGWVIGIAVAALLIVGLGALTGANSECGSQMGPNAPTLTDIGVVEVVKRLANTPAARYTVATAKPPCRRSSRKPIWRSAAMLTRR